MYIHKCMKYIQAHCSSCSIIVSSSDVFLGSLVAGSKHAFVVTIIYLSYPVTRLITKLPLDINEDVANNIPDF